MFSINFAANCIKSKLRFLYESEEWLLFGFLVNFVIIKTVPIPRRRQHTRSTRQNNHYIIMKSELTIPSSLINISNSTRMKLFNRKSLMKPLLYVFIKYNADVDLSTQHTQLYNDVHASKITHIYYYYYYY